MNILQMSVSAGLLALLVAAIRTVALTRLPKITFLVLWGVVLARLIIPVSIPSPFGFYTVPDSLFGSTPPAAAPAGEHVIYAAEQTPPPARDMERVLTPETLTIVWLAGMLAAAAFFAVMYIKNHRALRFATVIGGDEFINEWLDTHKLKPPIAVMRSDRVKTPIAAGILRPRVILPASLDLGDRELLRYVLAHEFCHLKRRDALWKLLMTAAVCAHWFNPMIWVMFALVSRDLELVCDETVLRRFGAGARTDYARTLISMAEQKNKLAPLYSGFSKNAAEERIVSIMKFRKSNIAVALAILAVLGTVTAFALSSLTKSPLPDVPDDGAAFVRVRDIKQQKISSYSVSDINAAIDDMFAELEVKREEAQQQMLNAHIADIEARAAAGEITVATPEEWQLHQDWLAGKVSDEEYFATFPLGVALGCFHDWVGKGEVTDVNDRWFDPAVHCEYYHSYYEYAECSKCGLINDSPSPYSTSKERHSAVTYTEPNGDEGIKCSKCGYIFS